MFNQVTATQVIVNAYRLIGRFDPNESVSGPDMALGIDMLNNVLNFFSSSRTFIPSRTEIKYTTIPNQSVYIVSVLIPGDIESNPWAAIDYASIAYGTFNVPLMIIDATEYYSFTTFNQPIFMPSSILNEVKPKFSQFTLYPVPNQAFNMTLRVRQKYSNMQLNDVFSQFPEGIYLYLTYELGKLLADFSQGNHWDQKKEEKYQTLKAQFFAQNDTDMQIRPNPLLNNYGCFRGRFHGGWY